MRRDEKPREEKREEERRAWAMDMMEKVRMALNVRTTQLRLPSTHTLLSSCHAEKKDCSASLLCWKGR